MKISKRKKYSLVQSFIVNTFFLLVMGSILGFYFIPTIQSIGEKKQELVKIFTQFNEISSKWLGFAEFKTEILWSDHGKDTYTKSMLKNMEPWFYITQFTNTWGTDYGKFLENRAIAIEEKKSKDSYIQREKVLNSLIPIYSKNGWKNEIMNDFYFINFVERLLYSFNLSSNNSIGVWTPQEVKKSENTKKESSQKGEIVSENIYEIPLSFTVTGQKKDIIQFIHYFENVWKIEYSEDSIIVQTDSFITRQIDGESTQEAYNIYNNQLATIESLELDSYPDSWVTTRVMNLIDKMNITQAREKYSVKLNVKFYVAGIPTYQMRSEVERFITDFTLYGKSFRSEIQKLIQKNQVNNSVSLTSVERAKSLENLFQSFEGEVSSIKQKLSGGATPQSVSESYVKILDLREKFEIIKNEMNKIIQK